MKDCGVKTCNQLRAPDISKVSFFSSHTTVNFLTSTAIGPLIFTGIVLEFCWFRMPKWEHLCHSRCVYDTSHKK